MRLAVSFIAIAIFAQDASDLLEKARDKLLPALPSGPKYVCDETIDRSYFSHNHSSLFRPSCEQLSIDRKKGGGRRRLDATDRLRVAVTVAQDREIYSWPGPGTFSRSVEEILQWGPIDTGAFSMYLTDIFTNPSVRFRIIDEPGTALEYGFRVPLEGSHLVVRGGAEWRPAGYDGTVSIDRSSLEIKRFTVESDELPPETSICEMGATAEYQGENTSAPLLPYVSRSHNIMRDTTETENVTTFSNCHEATVSPSRSEPSAALLLPERIPFELAFATAIDTASAAAGDVISARLTMPILQPKSGQVLVPVGATVTGRIVRMEHRLVPWSYFRVSIAFDTLQVDGSAFSLYARSHGNGEWTLRGQGAEEWPLGTFIFPSSDMRYVIPAGYKSTWWTTAPVSTK